MMHRRSDHRLAHFPAALTQASIHAAATVSPSCRLRSASTPRIKHKRHRYNAGP